MFFYCINSNLRSLSSFLLIHQPASAVALTVAFFDANGRLIVRIAFIYLHYLFNRCPNQTIHLTSIFILLRQSTTDQYCSPIQGPSQRHRHAPLKRPQRALHVRRRRVQFSAAATDGNGTFVVLSVIPAWHNESYNYSPFPSHADSTITVDDERLGWKNW